MKLRPTLRDARDKRFAFHRLFGGAVGGAYREIDNDAGLTMPDQNGDHRPEACTGYTVADIATDQDRVIYSHDYQFMKTLQVMGADDSTQGADARVAFKIPVAIGLLRKDQEPVEMETQSQAYIANYGNWPASSVTPGTKKPAFLSIVREPGQDWFDAVYNAVAKGFTVGLGTQWSQDFNLASYILPDNPTDLFWGHEYKIMGATIVNGAPYLKVKSWQGPYRYKKGVCLMSRTLVNKLMGTWGTYAATLAKLPSDVVDAQKQERITIASVLSALIQNLVIRYKILYGMVF